MDFLDGSQEEEGEEFCANCFKPCLPATVDPNKGGSEEEEHNFFGSSRNSLHHHIVIEKMSKVNSSIFIDSYEHEEENNRRTIKVDDALSKIYNLSYLSPSKDQSHDQEDGTVKNIGVCAPCSRALTKMYEGHEELTQLRHQSSYLAQSILKLDQMLQKLKSTLQNQSTEETVIESDVVERPTRIGIEIDDDDLDTFNDIEPSPPFVDELEEEAESTEIDQNLMNKDKISLQKDSLTFQLTSSSEKENGGPPWVRLKRLTSTEIASITRRPSSSSKVYKKRQHGLPKSKSNNKVKIKNIKRQNSIKIEDHDDFLFDSSLVTTDYDDEPKNDPDFVIGNDDADEEDYNPMDEECSSSTRVKKKSSSKKIRIKKVGNGAEKPKKKRGHKRKEEKDPTLGQDDETKKRKRAKSLPTLPAWSVWKSMIKAETEADVLRVDNKEPPFECKVCGKIFNSLTGMRVHALTEMGHTPYKCTVPGCSMSFVIHGFLTAHMCTHESVKEIECSICQKKFGSSRYLSQHMKSVHEKLKRFLCTECGKSFYGRAQLQRHGVSHGNSHPFNCETCGTTFKYSQTLARHMITVHAGDSNFLCTICGKSYNRPDYIREHMKRKHPDVAAID